MNIGDNKIEVRVLGVVSASGLTVGVNVDFLENVPCDSVGTGCIRSHSRTYDDVNDLMTALANADAHLAQRKPFSAKLDPKIPCAPNALFTGHVDVHLETSTVAITMEDDPPFYLDGVQLEEFRSLLGTATNVLAYIRPKVDAFNAAAPGIDTDPLGLKRRKVRLTPNNSLQPTSPSSFHSSCAAAELHR